MNFKSIHYSSKRINIDFINLILYNAFIVQKFLDLKFHDIPTTVAKACKVAAMLGVWMIDIHAFGGLKMMEAARNAIDATSGKKPLLIAVTVLTSFSEADLQAIGIHEGIEATVLNLAKTAQSAALDGVVCSPHEIQLLRANCNPEFTLVTPGIRLQQDILTQEQSNHEQSVRHDDQTRIMTPSQALTAGANYLVIGRPITQAHDPLKQLQLINENIN